MSQLNVDLTMSAEDDAYYKKLIDDLFAGKSDDEVLATDDEGLKRTVEKLAEAIGEGYGKKFKDVDYDSPDDGVLKEMEKNVYEFSAAKNYQTLKALNEALLDGKRIKSFDEFKRDASQILETYNVNYLRTEYNHAIAAAQQARKWNDYPEGALLKYETVGDERVREEHQKLEGVIAVKESKFWDTYYPPLGWGCRCTTYEVLNEKETDLTKIVMPEVPPTFQPNVGKYGQVYSKSSGYFVGIPKHILRRGVFAMPYEHQFKVVEKYPKGGMLKVHHVLEREKGNDYKDTLHTGSVMAKNGYNIEMRPVVYDKENRTLNVPNWDKTSNPDFKINGEYYDLKTPENNEVHSIKNRIDKAEKQTTRFVIQLEDDSHLEWLRHYSKTNSKIDNLMAVIGEKLIVLK